MQEEIGALFSNLRQTKLQLGELSTTLWDFMDTEASADDWKSVVYQDFVERTHVSEGLSRLISMIEPIVIQRNPFKGVYNFFFSQNFGTLDMMRADLQIRFNSERLWVPADDGVQIDCMWFATGGSNAPTMLICNPNAGYLEYAYFQNEWLWFYVSLRFNVFLWNYRGYGYTKGTSTPKRLQQDGLEIARYVKSAKAGGKFGVHGESLGGCVATYIASEMKVDFLFCDRTFSSLYDVSGVSYGCLAKTVFRMFTRWEINSVQQFLDAECYKVVSCDPDDAIIPNLASLKAGIATQTTTIPLPDEFDLDAWIIACRDCTRVSTVQVATDTPRTLEMVDATDQGTYKLLEKNGSVTEEVIRSIASRVRDTLEQLDAGGHLLLDLLDKEGGKVRRLTTAGRAWVRALLVWGTYTAPDSSTLFTNPRVQAIVKLKSAITGLNKIGTEVSASPNSVQAYEMLRRIESGLQLLSTFIPVELGELQQEASSRGSVGKLVPLTCGHNGCLSSNEKRIYQYHLQKAGMLPA